MFYSHAPDQMGMKVREQETNVASALQAPGPGSNSYIIRQVVVLQAIRSGRFLLSATRHSSLQDPAQVYSKHLSQQNLALRGEGRLVYPASEQLQGVEQLTRVAKAIRMHEKQECRAVIAQR